MTKSLHGHGVILPNPADGVPVSNNCENPVRGKRDWYKFKVFQNGTLLVAFSQCITGTIRNVGHYYQKRRRVSNAGNRP